MKKIALSFFVIAASAAYVWSQSGAVVPDDPLGAALPSGDAVTGSVPRRVPVATAPVPAAVTAEPLPLRKSEATVPAPTLPRASFAARFQSSVPRSSVPVAVAVADVPVSRARSSSRALPARFTRVAMTAPVTYTDGAYTGPAVDAYYGLIQIQAIVQGGRVAAIKVLQYPSDRRTSVYINRQALPMLRDEVISAQSANVDIISGATLTSEAFVRSLGAALKKAGS